MLGRLVTKLSRTCVILSRVSANVDIAIRRHRDRAIRVRVAQLTFIVDTGSQSFYEARRDPKARDPEELGAKSSRSPISRPHIHSVERRDPHKKPTKTTKHVLRD